MSVPYLNWTCDPETKRANRSPEFIRITQFVDSLVKEAVAPLDKESLAKLPMLDYLAPNIVAQLAHTQHMAPAGITPAEGVLLGMLLEDPAEIDLRVAFKTLELRDAFVREVAAFGDVPYCDYHPGDGDEEAPDDRLTKQQIGRFLKSKLVRVMP